MLISFRTIIEPEPGDKWKEHFQRLQVPYQRWYMLEGEKARPRYLTCRKKFKEYMPELIPIYEKLLNLAGNKDLEGRLLTLYNPPPFLSGCTQSVWTYGFPALIRNYDYTPKLFEGVILQTHWLKPVIAMSDCLWGILDGINGDGLAVSLTFGGSKRVADGFGIPIILRYILETCSTTAEATEILKRIPAHMTYNVTVIDALGYYITAFLSPNEPTRITHFFNTTNHQETADWEAYAQLSKSQERKAYLDSVVAAGYIDFNQFYRLFFQYPLYSTQYHRGFGTLYTALYFPQALYCDFTWPGYGIRCTFQDTEEQQITINYM